jgi:hypothetical protein
MGRWLRRTLLQVISSLIAFQFLACGGPTLSDADARATMNKAFEENSGIHKMPIGRTTVNGGLLGALKGPGGQGELADAPSWKVAGLIEMTTYTQGQGSWAETTTFTIAPTEKGVKAQAASIPAVRQALAKDPGSPSLPLNAKESAVGVWDWSSETLEGMTNGGLYLYGRYYSFAVGEIIENQEVKEENVNRFRTVKATLKTTWTELGTVVCKARNLPKRDAANLVALFQYDQFKKVWQLVASDITADDKPVKTEHVSSYLAAAKAGSALDSNSQVFDY